MANPLPYDERLERLLATAAQVFAAKGYHSTTMRDLSRATGLSLAGIYHYVKGKDELLFLVQERSFSRVLDGAERAVANGTEPLNRLQHFITHHVTFFAEHMDEMKVLSHEADSLSAERKKAIDGLKRRYVELLLGLIGDVNGNHLRLDARVATYALFGMMNWIYNWYDPEGSVPPADLALQFTDIFLRGLAHTPTSVSHGG